MIYFIPAWYQGNEWYENEQIWYIRRMHTEFDDTVKHIQLFHRSGVYPYQIMLLGFSPNFRHFIHRQGVYHAPYWSCFDAIQSVRRKKAAAVSFHNFYWPGGTEFVYTPFAVTAWYQGKKHAQIEFGEDGNPIRIDKYKKDKIGCRIIIDDRGFIAARVVYDADEKPLYQEYLTEDRVWKLRCFQNDGHVEVNPECADYLLQYRGQEQTRRFSRLSYDSLEQVIREVLLSYLSLAEKSDIFCVAMHGRHTELLKEVLRDRKIILSFFENRYCMEQHPEVLEVIEKADYIIADSRDNLRKIERQAGQFFKNSIAITPYDSRVDLGISQQLDVQKILVPIDGIDDDVLEELICLLGEYLSAHDKVQVHLFTRNGDAGWKKQILRKVDSCLRQAGLEKAGIADKFYAEQCVDEMAVSKCLHEQRLMLDMRKMPELYLQIMALSVGIPQIVCTWTEYVEQKRNGIILKDMKELHGALDYYLNGLSNWNEAMVCSVELGKLYATDRLLDAWKGVIEFIG